jgi:hypothetical protein
VNYADPKYDYAYAFNGSAWKWTFKETKGVENQFDKIISGKITMDDKIYVGIYANFSVKADKEAKKFTWDFGDGHKSYLQETKHKYEKDGKFEASLKITGDCEDKIYNFAAEVEKYEAPKIRMIGISPNPKGNDTGNEWILIQNKSKKKINLLDWSIATGSEKLYNHPIHEDFEIKAGKTKKLTREICAFTLNNQKTKIELRDPAGNVIQELKYDRLKNKIAEDEIYEKADSGWQWSAPPKENRIEEKIINETKVVIEPEKPKAIKPETVESEIINPESIGKYSENPAWQTKQENKIKLLSLGSKIKTPTIDISDGKVLGVETIKNYRNYSSFTEPIEEEHWMEKISNAFFIKLNSIINRLLLIL